MTRDTLKVEFHANENPLNNSEKNSICWSKVNVSNNKKATYRASVFLNAIKFLGFYIKNCSFNRKYIAKNYKSHYKTTIFDNYKADI